MSDDKIVMTRAEYQTALDLAATKAIVDRVEKSHDKQVKKTDSILTEISAHILGLVEKINRWPERLNTCRDNLKDEIHKDLKKFMTHKDGELMEQRLEAKVSEVNNKIKTNTIVIVTLAAVIQFGLTVAVLITQIAKITTTVPIP